MLNALVWAADGENCSTVERMLSDEPLDAGKDHAPAMDRFKAAVSSFHSEVLADAAERAECSAKAIRELLQIDNGVQA